jgi:hypothetical protein
MPEAAWTLAVPIGAASVSLPRDTVVSGQQLSVVSGQVFTDLWTATTDHWASSSAG